MDLGLAGKVAVVAASSKGLGKAVAMTLAREGALVTINGRDAETLRSTGREIRDQTGPDVLEVDRRPDGSGGCQPLDRPNGWRARRSRHSDLQRWWSAERDIR